jgi:uncharacterized membrane protein YedE/YeeE
MNGFSTTSLVLAAAGGVLIGLACAMYLLFEGRIAGVSGSVGRILAARGEDLRVRAGFLGGLVAGGVALRIVAPSAFGAPVASLPVLALAGLLVGWGTQLGNGCTSGHGVCGLGRRSPRSLVAVLAFMAVAFAVVFVTRHLLAGVRGAS